MISMTNNLHFNSDLKFKEIVQSYISSFQNNMNREAILSKLQAEDVISNFLSPSTTDLLEDLSESFTAFESRLLSLINHIRTNPSSKEKEGEDRSQQVSTDLAAMLINNFIKCLSIRLEDLGRYEKDECQLKQISNIFLQRTLSRLNTQPFSTMITEAELEDMPTPKFNNEDNYQTFTTKIFQSNSVRKKEEEDADISNKTKILLQCTYSMYKNNLINKRQRAKLKEMIYEKNISLFTITNNSNINTNINEDELSSELLQMINPQKL